MRVHNGENNNSFCIFIYQVMDFDKEIGVTTAS